MIDRTNLLALESVEDLRHRRRPSAFEDNTAHGSAEHLEQFRLFDLDGVFAFALFAPILFLVELQTMGAAAVCLCTVAYACYRRESAMFVVGRCWPYFLFPLFAVISTIWSESPADTLRHSLEYSVTVGAALLLSTSRNPRSVTSGMFLAFSLFAVISLAAGNTVDVGNTGATALSGLDDSKNELADCASTGFLVSLLTFFIAMRTRSLGMLALAVAVGSAQAYAVFEARSSGALAGVCLSTAVFLVLIAARRLGRSIRVFSMALVGTLAATAGVVFVCFTSDVLDWLSEVFGKDATLTGRTYLWSRAAELVKENPLLGHGFAAFWRQGNLDAEGLWQFAHIENRSGFNFHSTNYEILVALGWVGLFVFGVTLIAGFIEAAIRYLNQPTLFACFCLGIGTYIVVRMPVETLGTYEFNSSTLILYLVFASGAVARAISGSMANVPWSEPHGSGRHVRAPAVT